MPWTNFVSIVAERNGFFFRKNTSMKIWPSNISSGPLTELSAWRTDRTVLEGKHKVSYIQNSLIFVSFADVSIQEYSSDMRCSRAELVAENARSWVALRYLCRRNYRLRMMGESKRVASGPLQATTITFIASVTPRLSFQTSRALGLSALKP